MKEFLVLRVTERTGFQNPFPYKILGLENVIETSTAYLALKMYMNMNRAWCSKDYGYYIGRVGTGLYSIFDEFDRTVCVAVENGYRYYDSDSNRVTLTKEELWREHPA